MENLYASFDNRVANEELLNRGVNPYPKLTIQQSRRLIYLMSGVSLTPEQHEESGRLQRKACGMQD